MPKEDIFEKSGAQDLTEEQMEKISRPTEKEKEDPRENFREIEDESKVAPIVPQDPRKIDGWDKLTVDRQMELMEKYKKQKEAWEEWERKENVVPFDKKEKEAA